MGLFDRLFEIPGLRRPSASLGGSLGLLQAVGSGQIRPALERAVLEARRYACSCSIIVNGKGRGTGFLIGKDIVLTNYHVVDDGRGALCDPSAIHCRFGFYDADEYRDGRHAWVPLTTEKAAAFPASSPTAPGDRNGSLSASEFRDNATGLELYDYAVLRLAKSVGELAGKGPLGEMNPLGWIAVDRDYPVPAIGQPLYLIEFPERSETGVTGFQQDASSFSEGRLGSPVCGGIRFRHDAATRRGASGSGVFDSKSMLIGLHNSGKELPDRTAENRFIPILRILDDIQRQNETLFREIIETAPPSLTISGASKRTREAVLARVTAAKIFLDREREHASIIAALDVQSGRPVQVNHVVCNYEFDEIDFFIQRLTISAAHIERRHVAEVTTEFLRGQPGSFVPWAESSLTWPEPKTPIEQARIDLSNQLLSQIAGPRTLLVIGVSDLDERDRSEELAYMKLLGEVLSGYPIGNEATNTRQMLQAVVVYQLTSSTVTIASRFAPLWTTTNAPPNCGVSVALAKVQRNDVQSWVTLLNQAWSLRNRIAVPDAFKPSLRLSMKEVFGLLENTIAEAAMAVVEQTFEDNR